jgi:predicted aminopeptidase
MTTSIRPFLRAIAMPAIGAAATLCALALTACADLPYYWQAANGQLDLWRRARPIEDWLADPWTGEPLKDRLRQAQAIRAFASRELGLPDNGTFRRYADVQRAFLVWNVFAAREFSVTPKEWCFPVAGCVTYRGYFTENAAQSLAGRLAAQGYETYVGGVPAYSTLGWFSDPIPSTVIAYSDTDLARLIFHELAHQTVYVPGDTTFNESFATAVELEGAHRWVLANGPPGTLATLEQTRITEGQFANLILAARARLAEIYAGPGDTASKRAAKQRVTGDLRAAYARQAPQWSPTRRYARWFAGPINNAQIASVAAYIQRIPAFDALIAEAQGDLRRFYAEARRLAKLPRLERDQQLDVLGRVVQTDSSGRPDGR